MTGKLTEIVILLSHVSHKADKSQQDNPVNAVKMWTLCSCVDATGGGQTRGGKGLLFEAEVANVSLIYPDDGVILREEALLLDFATTLQPLDEQALSPSERKQKTNTLAPSNTIVKIDSGGGGVWGG